jgi:hypothetical protein
MPDWSLAVCNDIGVFVRLPDQADASVGVNEAEWDCLDGDREDDNVALACAVPDWGVTLFTGNGSDEGGRVVKYLAADGAVVDVEDNGCFPTFSKGPDVSKGPGGGGAAEAMPVGMALLTCDMTPSLGCVHTKDVPVPATDVVSPKLLLMSSNGMVRCYALANNVEGHRAYAGMQAAGVLPPVPAQAAAPADAVSSGQPGGVSSFGSGFGGAAPPFGAAAFGAPSFGATSTPAFSASASAPAPDVRALE